MRIGVRCDAGDRIGVGHLIRCVALAEELVHRGIEVLFLGALHGPAWIRAQLDARELPLLPAPATAAELARFAVRLRLDAMVIDSYETDPGCGAELRRAGVPVLAIVDGDLRGQEADLYLDQNLGAEVGSGGVTGTARVELPPGAVRLAGVRFVLLRDSVRERRPYRPMTTWHDPVRMLCVFGGTDAADAAPTVARLAVATGVPFTATIVAARESTARALAALPLLPDQSVTPILPTDRLPELAARTDLAVSAAGSSTWELLCLGVPTALLWVADNQRLGYEATVSRRLTAGLGNPAHLRDAAWDWAKAALRELLTKPEERAALAARGHGLIDGRGRERVADALLAL